ncbi:unnamed protein product [Rhodiola kirilowii]
MAHPNPGKNPVSINMENNQIVTLLSSTHPRSSSQFSTINSENKSPALEYVYQRKKPQKQYIISSRGQSSINKPSGVSSAVSSETKFVSAREENTIPECLPELGVSNCDPLPLNSSALVSSRALQICGPEEAPKRNIRPPGINVGSSEKDFCLSFLRSRGLLGNGHIRTSSVGESINETFCTTTCKTCRDCESTTNLLICDGCDSAFHAWCCHPRVNDIPTEEWFCKACRKKKQDHLKEMKLLRLQKITEEEVGNNSVDLSGVVLTSYDMMLLNTETHKSEVRVGKGFQADVPEWSEPNPSDSYFLGEALEIGPSESERSHNSRFHNPSKVGPIGNWLQCREVIRGVKEGIDGTICGKWRRAPLSEVQTDEWECFDAVLWDPSHSDCAASQELETEEVIKQLRYLQMLKPSATAKRQKVSYHRRRPPTGPSRKAGDP